jgi:hypothetical protein
MLCVVYGLNYLDKTTLSYASIMGLQTDIGLHGTNYQWLGSMFYIGYIAWEYPTVSGAQTQSLYCFVELRRAAIYAVQTLKSGERR